MPVPVNNVKGKQKLNDQTHYTSEQIKATRDSDVVFTMCACVYEEAESVFVYCVCVCVEQFFSFPQPECFVNHRGLSNLPSRAIET